MQMLWAVELKTLLERFEEKYVVADSGCWEWTGYKDDKGYGRSSTYRRYQSNTLILAHRISWELYHGDIPKDDSYYGTLLVCHHCDNPGCVNPNHLFLGTQKDNMQDCKRKGRTRKGVQRDVDLNALQKLPVLSLLDIF